MGILVLALLLSCGDTPYEGDEAGECTDGADNDRDGYFDCEDNGCWNHPDCEGGETDTDTDTDSDTDTDTDTDTDPVGHLASMTVSYTVDWNVDPDNTGIEASVCSGFGICDCTTTFSGGGTRFATEGTRATFLGTWALSESDCEEEGNQAFEEAIYTHESGTAYHSLVFSSDLRQLQSWVTHQQPGEHEPHPTAPHDHGQAYLTELEAPFDGASASHSELERFTIDGLIPMELTHELLVTVTSD